LSGGVHRSFARPHARRLPAPHSMCGIAAFLTRHALPDATGIALAMACAQAHRGPDAQGAETVSDGVTLAHARLSIVDLSANGNQPLRSEDGGVAVVCNGEIYNHAELRAGLEARGHRFRSHSDSEVLVHLWEERGAALLHDLRGMFAFVLADTRSGDVLVARDRLGKKPVVYAETADGVAIASEQPALSSIPGVDWAIDPEALALYLLRNLRHVPDPWTLHRGVRRLEPGHAMLVRAGRIVRRWRYWHPEFSPRPMDEVELLARFDEAVALRMVADVEVAALLSGGVDSTAIIDSMQRQGAASIRTYALGRDADDEELARARAMAARYGTRHTEVFFDPDRHHEFLVELIRRHGEPIMLLPLGHAYDLFRHVRDDGIRVVMTGHGADEVFFGYNGHRRSATLSSILAAFPAFLRPAARAVARLGAPGSELREAMLVAGADIGHRKAALYADEVNSLLRTLFLDGHAPAALESTIDRWFGTWFGDSPAPAAFVDEAAVIGLMHENAHSVTIAGDLPAMAASIEVRCPFLDSPLVEAGLRVPYREKVGDRLVARENKRLLKRALESRLPRDVLYAPKRGFGYHIQEADLLRGAWRARVSEAFSGNAPLGGHIDRARARAMWERFLSGGSASAQLIAKLYAIAVFEAEAGGATLA
jgi:asparagine synthase (glutamine-hydrolysing)